MKLAGRFSTFTLLQWIMDAYSTSILVMSQYIGKSGTAITGPAEPCATPLWLAFNGLSVHLVRVTTLSRSNLQVAKKSAVDSFVFREVQNTGNGWLRWANHAITREQNFASKNLSIQGQANVAFYLYYSYQCLVFSEQCGVLVADEMTHTHTTHAQMNRLPYASGAPPTEA